MSGEIVVSETPNWLKGLEEKREQRLKVRLGHEAGAGAPCLKCGDKCPGLDLHFWRKACKICRCPKEEHDVPDDDVYGWAQFQLLGSKPNKIKTKIVLPGKKDEVELEWAPKGQKETIDKYLKTLPPEALPVKGSQAAQERKQMLQKQIPIHDIDPSLCHELNEEEVKKMEEYIAHIKKSSVGVGQIVNLSSVIKANLHNISPQEAHIIASRYSKGIPFSEIIKLQSGLAKNLEKLTVNDPRNLKNKSPLPNMQPNKLGGNITEEDMQNPSVASKFKDITHPWYTGSSPNKGPGQPQYAQGYKPGQSGGLHSTHPDLRHPDYSIDQKLLEGTNFDPSKTPSQFRGYNTPGYRPVQHGGPQSQGQYPNAEGVPYDKMSSRPQGNKVSYSSDIERSKALKSGGLGSQKEGLPYDKVSGSFKPGELEALEGVHSTGPNYAENLLRDRNLPHSEQYGFENPYFSQNLSGKDPKHSYGAAGTPLKTMGQVPGYSPSKYDPQVDFQDPKAPKSMKDLIYSAYDPSKGPLPEDNDETTEKSKNIDPAAAGYDPNVTFNTYKHDPSVIRYENHPLLGKNDPAQPLGGNKSKFGPGILKYTGQGYFDPKTGNYVPGQGQFGPGHPNYDPKNPQNPSGPGQVDPKTGKYVGEDYKPRHAGQGSFGPGHPNYDPKNHQNPSGPGRIDPKTGKYVGEDYKPRHAGQESFGPGHPNYDPKIPYGSGYFDPDTGKFIPASGNKAQDGNYVPRNAGAANYDPEYPNNDPNPYGSGYFDPKTGKYILSDANNPEGGYYDPRNPGPGNLGAGDPNYDPYNPYRPGYFDPTTGKFIDRDDNNPEQERFDPAHPNYVPQNTYGPGYVDPKTGQYIRGDDGDLDPSAPYDPMSPAAPHGTGLFDPKTGAYVPGAGGFDPQTGKYLPGQENPSYPPPYSRYPSDRPQNIPGLEEINPTNLDAGSYRKLLSQLQPGQMNIPEDYLEPHMVNIGAIQDINPDIKAATTEVNPGFDNESVYSDNGAEYSPDSIREILNNVKLPDCHYCKKPFEENEYAVTVDRANVLFHAHCFRCAGCNQSLADNIYFYHKETDNVYCGRDYAKIKGYPRCTACDELIFTKEYCLAENATFHLKHFCCFQCDTPLAGQDYTLEDEKPYCLPCYETSKAAKCSTCEKVIKPDERGCQLNGVHFHADDACFRCIVCSQPLMGKKLLLRNEKLYCSHDCFNSVKK